MGTQNETKCYKNLNSFKVDSINYNIDFLFKQIPILSQTYLQSDQDNV